MHEERYRLVPLNDRYGAVRAYALVDLADYAPLTEWRWCLNNYGYAVRRAGPSGSLIYMHRQILGLERGDKTEGDHCNRNRLDNRRANLRRITHAENMGNRCLANWTSKPGEAIAALPDEGREHGALNEGGQLRLWSAAPPLPSSIAAVRR